ncbi:hypothetical protein H0H93_014382, partial [Arthromyces matolae]
TLPTSSGHTDLTAAQDVEGIPNVLVNNETSIQSLPSEPVSHSEPHHAEHEVPTNDELTIQTSSSDVACLSGVSSFEYEGPNPEFVTDLPTYPSLPESERRHLDEVVSLSKIRYDSLLKVCKYYDLEIQRQKKYLLCLRQNGPDLSEDALHDLFSPNIVATRLISSWQDVCMKHRSESCVLATRCCQLPLPAFKDLRTILTVIDQQHRELGERYRHFDLDLEQVLTQCDDYWDDFVSGLDGNSLYSLCRSESQ